MQQQKTRNFGQSPTWGHRSLQVRLEIRRLKFCSRRSHVSRMQLPYLT